MAAKKQERSETHQRFPSGDWEGFYTYASGPQAEKHQMQCQLNFKAGRIHGVGNDDVGPFSWKGAYNKQLMECAMTKTYRSKAPVKYQGYVDENGIWGTWTIGQLATGGFHLWPKATAQQKEHKEKASKKRTMVGG